MKKNHTDVNALPAITTKYIINKAVTTSRCTGLSFQDEDDLKQTLFLAAIRARENYDPSRNASLETLLHTVVDRALLHFLRDRRRCKRLNVVCVLDANECDAGFELGDDEENNETMAERIPDETGSGIPETDLRMDVAEGLKRLDPTARRVCELVMSGKSLRQAGMELGIPAWTLNRKIVPAIAAQLKGFLAS